MTNLIHLTLANALKGLENKDFTAVELTQAHLDAMEAAKSLNAFITETPELALKQAEESDKRRASGQAGLLDGAPVAVKDLFCTKDVRTTAGNRILDNFVPPYESTVTEKLFAAGAVMTGKTNLDAFGMGSATSNTHYGQTFNPWRRKDEPDTPLVSRRVVRRLRSSRGGTSVSGSPGHGHRRVYPPTFSHVRHYRHSPDLRALLPLGHDCLRFIFRPGRGDGPERGRLCPAPQSHQWF